MNLSTPAVSYIFLVIPTFFALTVLLQGVSKLSKGQDDGPIAIGFGVFLLLLIAVFYWWFIR